MIWKLDQSQAEFRFNDWHGHFDLAHPEQGLQIVGPGNSKLNNLLGVFFTQPHQPILQDCYARQGDLIVVYPPRELRKFHLQLDVRLLESTSESLLVELWISVQTYLLDNHPAVKVGCPVLPTNVDVYRDSPWAMLERDETGLLVADRLVAADPLVATVERKKIAVIHGQFPDLGMNIAWFNHPRDQVDTAWSQATDKNGIEAKLFGHFMEKGVIRRSRMRCAISNKSQSQADLESAYQAFVASPLPLTA